tara:strand:+ start:1434 stop:2498 length:1065 start_codon:yes stop_codon:yes gene_type:complete
MSRAREFADLASSADSGGIAGKNLLDNAGFLVAQKGTSFSITNPNAPLRGIDRWTYRRSGTFANVRFTVSQSTGPSAGNLPHAMKIETTTVEGNNPNDNEAIAFAQAIERQDIEHIGFGTNTCKPLTMSFYVKSSITGTFYCALYVATHTKVVHKSYTVSSANTWEYKTVTFPALTSGTANSVADNAIGAHIYWVIDSVAHASGTAGSYRDTTGADNNPLFPPSGTSSTGFVNTSNATFEISGCKLEVGEQATPFELKSKASEEIACNRYFYEASPKWIGLINADNTTITREQIQFPVRMRASPTVTNSGVSTNFSIGTVQTNDKAHNFEVSHAGATDFRPALVTPNFKFDAEL